MKIAYTIDNTSKNINISKSDLDNKVLVSWADKSSQMASLELTANGLKEYLWYIGDTIYSFCSI